MSTYTEKRTVAEESVAAKEADEVIEEAEEAMAIVAAEVVAVAAEDE